MRIWNIDPYSDIRLAAEAAIASHCTSLQAELWIYDTGPCLVASSSPLMSASELCGRVLASGLQKR
jgi:hypothetical protein